ncbi:hypothetical protein HD554DRAFT_2175357 [Boletus coccyginus]|nr:hypothetical protein HD554DRAFT_2175357 [Boletus coccyginus]
MSNIERSSRTAFGSSPRSSIFQSSVHQIPIPGIENPRSPRYEPFVLKTWLVGGVALLTITLGIALQAALYVSQTRWGFAVPDRVVSFMTSQSLVHFTTVLFVIPFKYYWSAADQMLRCYQPYVTLSEGNASAPRSILLDYVALGQFSVVYHSWINKHYLINVSMLVAISFVPVPLCMSTALVTSTIGLSPAMDNLDAFFASTGAAGSYLNGTLAVNITAIQTKVNCDSPKAPPSVMIVNGSYVASATFPSGCSAQNVFSPANGAQQSNVVNASRCAAEDLDIVFQPVVFWFYLNATTPQVASVYCNPTMDVFTVGTSMNLSNGLLGPCSEWDGIPGTNNVTGSPQYGRPYNGVVFDQEQRFQCQLKGISLLISAFLMQSTATQPSNLEDYRPFFNMNIGFLNATTVHLCELDISPSPAQSNFFLASNSKIHARLTSENTTLYSAYVISALMIVIGLVGFLIHCLHRHARRRLWLTCPPGSIAAIVSLTSRSGFGELLLPYDDERQIRDNLAGLTFCLDPRTGAIITEEDFGAPKYADGVALLGGKRPYRNSAFLVDDDSALETTLARDSDDTP